MDSERSHALVKALRSSQCEFSPIVELGPDMGPPCILDLSKTNPRLNDVDLTDTPSIAQFIATELELAGAKWAIGGYGEERVWYQRSSLFEGENGPRTIHLGVDIWLPASTKLKAPLSGIVHSAQDNVGRGDYGPTILLEHMIEGVHFYSLYGHLSRESLEGKVPNRRILAGQVFAEIGNFPTNGDWPPHVHFQLIFDLLGNKGDFPGVTTLKERDYFLEICPDPNLLLRFSKD